MRERLSWSKEKVAEIEKKADPYTMNQDHKNPPASKYDIGGPSEFAESPDTKTPWKNEGRTETGHPSPEREAVKAAYKMEDKALQCITVAQRMLPGASDDLIEEQATDLMYMPDRCIMATLQRQAQLAENLVAQEEEPEEKEEEKEEKKEEKKPVEAKKEKKEEEEKPVEAKKEKKEEEEKPVEAKKEKKEEEEKPVEAKKEEKKEEEEEEEEIIEASEPDLLDNYFTSMEKTGAKKLSGIVKQAKTDNVDSLLWSAPPDVSEAFR